MSRFGKSLATVVSTLLLTSIAFAQQPVTTTVPNLIRYAGSLNDTQGGVASSSATGVTFAIYRQQDGGAPIWMETQNVTADVNGQYSALLGCTTTAGLPGDLFSQQEQRWLGVQVQGQGEQPRVLLVSVPYAFKAHDAETLGGKSVSDFVLANGANSSAVVDSGIVARPNNASNLPAPSAGTHKGATSDGPTNFSGSTTDQIVGVTQSGTGTGVNASASSNAVLGIATGATGTTLGVQGVVSSTGGYAVFGNATATTGGNIGVKGTSNSSSGTGVRGTAIAATGNTAGVSGWVASAAGTAGVFHNASGGKILSGQSIGVEKFSVDGSGNVNALGAFTGSGAGLTGIQFSQLSGTLASSQLRGAYGNAVTLSNGGNSFTGNGTGLTGVLPAGGSSNYIQNGTAQQANANFNISGNGTANSFNTAGTYQVYGSVVLSIGDRSDANLFLGVEAGVNDVVGFGQGDVFSGYYAGHYNTWGSFNTFSGFSAGYNNTMGESNVFVGYSAGLNNTTGSANTFLGNNAGLNNTTGHNDLYIANGGPQSGTESNAIRIGDSQSAAYVAAIYGSTSANGVPVYINSDGLLGTQTSSLRFKEQVRDMGDSTGALMKLRPVTFLYKPEYADGERTLQYGLIAEEVAKVYPQLVAYDNDGKPYTVRYQYLASMLLNEVQKEYRRVENQAEVIKGQQHEIESLKQELQLQNASLQERLSRLERAVRMEAAAK